MDYNEYRMKRCEIKNVGVGSFVKILLPIYVIIGAVTGVITIFTLPQYYTIAEKLAGWIVFMILYTLIMAGLIVLIGWLYNKLSKSFGGIVIEFEETSVEGIPPQYIPKVKETPTVETPMMKVGIERIYCSRCGAENKIEYNYCIRCGAELQKSQKRL